MKVREFLEQCKRDIIVCRHDDSLQSAATLLRTNKIGALPVLDAQGNLVGVVSERDIVAAFSSEGQNIVNLKVEDVMSPSVITCQLDDELITLMKVMTVNRVRHLPVVDNDKKLLGIISIGDCMARQLQEKELEANVLRDSVIAARFS